MTRRARTAWVGVGTVALSALVGACRAPGTDTTAPPAPAAVSVGAESVARVTVSEIRSGPSLSGELRAAREATVRAKLAGSVLNVTVEEGQAVSRGTVMARIEARPLEDALVSSQSGVRSAEQALSVAQREADRVATLVKGGALADRDRELADSAVVGAQAQLADARARLASVRQQLDDTAVVAPISGVVSDRPANEGDVVSPGSPIATIIDPSSMRLEASVPSEFLSILKRDLPVEFEVRGYPGELFQGRVERISPAADPVTRQVTIFVAIPNLRGNLVAGLFAEGRVASLVRETMVVPSTAVEFNAASPWVLRVRDGKAERVPVTLGVRDDRGERVEVRDGLLTGDVLLIGAARSITPGTPVSLNPQPAAAAAR